MFFISSIIFIGFSTFALVWGLALMHGFITNPKSDANWLNLGFILPFDFSVLALSIIVDALSIKTSSIADFEYITPL